jgi:prolyl-tRNA synthetase
MIADRSVQALTDAVTGQSRQRPSGSRPPAAISPRRLGRSRLARPRRLRPADAVDFRRGIEVGHIFKLGTKYSEALHATCLDASGAERAIIMGTYGIGIGRTAAAAIEQNHDANGIIWPAALAPFAVTVLPLQPDPEVRAAAERILREIEEQGAWRCSTIATSAPA